MGDIITKSIIVVAIAMYNFGSICEEYYALAKKKLLCNKCTLYNMC